MPELPEVEVVKRSLESKIQNKIIKKVKINDIKLRYKLNIKKISQLNNLKIKKIERRSKYLLFHFDKPIIMLVHLGMTGKFFFINENKKKFKTSFYYNLNEAKDQKYDRVIFFLKNRQKFIYNDLRKFGFIKLLSKNKIDKNLHLISLGPEPLSKYYNFDYFKNYICQRKKTVKDLLMDQKFVSGLGNIYVNEILFSSKVKPTRKIKFLKDNEIKEIIKNTKKILSKSIKLGGASIKDFSSSNGKKGSFQQHFRAYAREGEKCSNIDCKKKIIRIIISNRSSFYCLSCQK